MNAKAIRTGLAAALLGLGLAAGAADGDSKAPTAANAAAQVPASVDAALRKNLPARMPNFPPIDQISRTPMQGIYEVRIGTELFYTDGEGNYIINGEMMDTRARRNLTEERMEKILALDFSQLPVKDAFVVVRGNGKRKLAVFEDPNCGYCKRFERDLQKIDNVTVYMFLYPILGPDSTEKSRAIWCSKDKGAAWSGYMLRNEPPAKADASCDVSALARNIEFGRKHKITGTPTLVFADGSRVPGAIGAADVEKLLAAGGK
ncbi:DsbC family protein [Ramlibacter montanisoli]|uniref:Thiol:disulfide interchange protein n=1 Tax=Ramlibacter montanisoli TaxID=2732512 RepID=A0A849KE65_9BURK|nr:DsbC family protein [Ramlibacter montanisoli]NNU44477.1 DsbC family protein [Ramlibacter montanisoli]